VFLVQFLRERCKRCMRDGAVAFTNEEDDRVNPRGTPLASQGQMMTPFWLIWLVFLCMFLVMPVGYGWGYRGWGAPYPRYIQQRRALRAGAGPSSFNHQAWGRSGDFIWIGIMIAGLWAFSAFLFMR